MGCHRYTLNMQVSSETKNNSSSKRAILHHRNDVVQWYSLFSGNGTGTLHIKVWRESDCKQNLTRRKTSHKTTAEVSTMHALYSSWKRAGRDRSDAVLRLFLLDSNRQIPVLIRRCNLVGNPAVTSTYALPSS
ncbi:hypothetical protein TNCV_2791701 [Trichonephila clavipes]|nr:hypothetical protein TNCV_2791701 [Trichonephila clavipes]